MVGIVSWGGDTLVEGVEHVEGSGVYRKICTYPISCFTVRISAANTVGGVNMGSTDCVLFPNSQSISLRMFEHYIWRIQ